MTIAARWRSDDDLRLAALRLSTIGLWIGAGALALIATTYYVTNDGIGMDAHAYWLAGQRANPYGPGPGEKDAFLYSPLFAQAMRPLALLPWPVFYGLVVTICAVVYYWLLRPLPIRWRVPALLFCVPELLIGNIYALLAASLVMAISRPEALAFPALTKITPALPVGVWFLVRGEWRNWLRAVAMTLFLALLSFVLEPDIWREWFGFLAQHRGAQGIEYPLRVALAILLATYAARRNVPWLLAIAFCLSMPLARQGFQSMVPLVAIVRLLLPSGRTTETSAWAVAPRSGLLPRLAVPGPGTKALEPPTES